MIVYIRHILFNWYIRRNGWTTYTESALTWKTIQSNILFKTSSEHSINLYITKSWYQMTTSIRFIRKINWWMNDYINYNQNTNCNKLMVVQTKLKYKYDISSIKSFVNFISQTNSLTSFAHPSTCLKNAFIISINQVELLSSARLSDALNSTCKNMLLKNNNNNNRLIFHVY